MNLNDELEKLANESERGYRKELFKYMRELLRGHFNDRQMRALIMDIIYDNSDI